MATVGSSHALSPSSQYQPSASYNSTDSVHQMGMHRDGARWNLPDHVVEERRKVFWECNSADIFQAHCFSRPSALNPDHCDTLFPVDTGGQGGEKSYSILRFELSQISSE